jgi:hypothetical protein
LICAGVLALLAAFWCQPAGAHTLRLGAATRAAKLAADAYAHHPTTVRRMERRSRHAYTGATDFIVSDPHGCPGCGYDPARDRNYDTPTAYRCELQVIVRFRSRRSRRVAAKVDGFACERTFIENP